MNHVNFQLNPGNNMWVARISKAYLILTLSMKRVELENSNVRTENEWHVHPVAPASAVTGTVAKQKYEGKSVTGDGEIL